MIEDSRIWREYPITSGRLEGQGRRAKPLTADYVLEYRNTKLAVLEAKPWDDLLTEGVAQAKNYAGKLALRFAYSSNGQGIYGIDMQTGRERELPKYPTNQLLLPSAMPSLKRSFACLTAEVCIWRSPLVEVSDGG